MILVINGLFIGMISGWIAGKIMKKEAQFLRNAMFAISSFCLGSMSGLLDISHASFMEAIIISVIGACALIFLIDKLADRYRTSK